VPVFEALGFPNLPNPSLYNDEFPHVVFLTYSVVFYLSSLVVLWSAVNAKWITWVPNKYAFVHNVDLTILSVAMFSYSIYIHLVEGAFSSYKNFIEFPTRMSELPGLLFVADIFYWSKFLELIDTYILILRHKDLSFLHVFHHCTTAGICFASRWGCVSFGVWTNAFVHLFMYFHFARPIPFIRRSITTIQIVQFLYCLVFFHRLLESWSNPGNVLGYHIHVLLLFDILGLFLPLFLHELRCQDAEFLQRTKRCRL